MFNMKLGSFIKLKNVNQISHVRSRTISKELFRHNRIHEPMINSARQVD